MPRTSQRPRRSRPSVDELRGRLDALVAATDRLARRESDPVGFVHRYEDPDDREVVGLIAALLAFGNVVAIRRSIARVLDVLGPSPAAAVDGAAPGQLARALDGFAHRVWVGADVAALLDHVAALRRAHGSLAAAFAAHRAAESTFLDGLARFADALRGPAPSAGLKHLVPDPRRGSACKRLLLYLRWMVRPDDGVDLGLFDVPPSELVIPVDTHVQRIARNLRLTERRDASLRTAREITAALAALDPDDPVRYDFALCHLGISRACPSRRDPALCARCVVKDVCRHWR
jgi:uncharacterized protein (TIGR02757 family)